MTIAARSDELLYYKHSGQFSAMGLPVALVASLAAAIILGAVYAYIDLYCPIVYVNFFATAGFGFAVGWVTALLLRWGRVRNNVVTKIVAALTALGALYSSWVFWVFALFQKSFGALPLTPVELAIHPLGLGRTIQAIAETGTWSIGHIGSSHGNQESVHGIWLWAVWIIEAGIIAWLAISVTVSAGKALPYCERCQAWCRVGRRLFSTPPGDNELLKQRLESKDFAYLMSLGPEKKPLPSKWYEVYLHKCDQCRDFNTLTVKAVSMQVNKKGQQQKKERAIVDKLLLSDKELQSLQMLKEQYLSQQAASASAAPPETAGEPPQAHDPAT